MGVAKKVFGLFTVLDCSRGAPPPSLYGPTDRILPYVSYEHAHFRLFSSISKDEEYRNVLQAGPPCPSPHRFQCGASTVSCPILQRKPAIATPSTSCQTTLSASKRVPHLRPSMAAPAMEYRNRLETYLDALWELRKERSGQLSL
jgi:hypothetical protein